MLHAPSPDTENGWTVLHDQRIDHLSGRGTLVGYHLRCAHWTVCRLEAKAFRCGLDILPILRGHIVVTNEIVAAYSVGNPTLRTDISTVGRVVFQHFGSLPESASPRAAHSGAGGRVGLSLSLSFGLRLGLRRRSGWRSGGIATAMDKCTLVAPCASTRGTEFTLGSA